MGQLGQLDPPETVAVPVGPAGIGGDHETFGLGIALFAHGLPPPADGVDGEGSGIVVGSYLHPALVGADVVDAIGDGLGDLWVGEVVDVDPFG